MTAAAEQFDHIALDHIWPSTTNPRKTFDKKALDELAESINRQGVVSPILVRPHPEKPKHYELVAGERRFRASKLAQRDTIPAVIRILSDADSMEIQVIENLHREDLHPIEEAEGYEKLLTMTHPNGKPYTVDDVAAKVNKSKSYVYGRMKLCALVSDARKAFFDGKFNASVALILARIPVPELQAKALAEIADDSYEGGGMGAAEARDYVHRTYMLRLDQAPFKTADASLVPEAGACGPCPKRTGNQKELFADIKGPDLCTDPVCFAKKREAGRNQLLEAAVAKGQTVITGDAAKKIKPHEYSARLTGDWIALDEHCYDDAKNRTYRAILGKSAGTPTLLQHPDSDKLIEIVRFTEVAPTLKAKGIKPQSSRPGNVQNDHYKQLEAKARAEGAVRREVLTQIRAKVGNLLSIDDLRLVAKAFYAGTWNEHQKRVAQLWAPKGEKPVNGAAQYDLVKSFDKLLDKMAGADLVRTLIDLALIKDVHIGAHDGNKGERLFGAAKRYRVDVAKIRKGLKDGKTPARKAAKKRK